MPHRDRGRSTALILSIVTLVAGLLVLPATAAAPVRAGEPTDRLPDLRAAYPGEMRIVSSNGRRLLRLTALMVNRGAGPMEIRATRSTAQSGWDVDQRIYDTSGGSRLAGTGATLRFAGDGHDHWHVVKMMAYHLWSGAGTRGDDKIGFCFFDTTRLASPPPGAPSTAQYREAGCGGRNALLSRTGISVGWGDRYGWDFAYQWIDISGLPGGTYTLRAKVDPQEHFLETDESNNCAWVQVRFGSTGSSVSVLGSGKACKNDYAGTMFEGPIGWAFEQGITGGCELDLFCPGNGLNRGQAASFIARALALPPATKDWFDDDDGKTHEADINRIGEAGITTGCGERRYCPSAIMTRAQMATMLVRALDLPPATSTDRFSDDDDSSHEAHIDALAEAGLTGGCAPDRFCPDAPVTRGQMVTFLYRSLAEAPG